jgi:hypothetical protein
MRGIMRLHRGSGWEWEWDWVLAVAVEAVEDGSYGELSEHTE